MWFAGPFGRGANKHIQDSRTSDEAEGDRTQHHSSIDSIDSTPACTEHRDAYEGGGEESVVVLNGRIDGHFVDCIAFRLCHRLPICTHGYNIIPRKRVARSCVDSFFFFFFFGCSERERGGDEVRGRRRND